MKNTQLRTGNLVLHGNIVKTIDGITRGHVCFTEDIPSPDKYGEWQNLDDVEFIPLTKEWLDKFLFLKYADEDDNDIYVKDSVELISYLEERFEKFYLTDYNLEIAAVHQLQNLYSALTGKELIYDVSHSTR